MKADGGKWKVEAGRFLVEYLENFHLTAMAQDKRLGIQAIRVCSTVHLNGTSWTAEGLNPHLNPQFRYQIYYCTMRMW